MPAYYAGYYTGAGAGAAPSRLTEVERSAKGSFSSALYLTYARALGPASLVVYLALLIVSYQLVRSGANRLYYCTNIRIHDYIVLILSFPVFLALPLVTALCFFLSKQLSYSTSRTFQPDDVLFPFISTLPTFLTR